MEYKYKSNANIAKVMAVAVPFLFAHRQDVFRFRIQYYMHENKDEKPEIE